MLLHDVFGRIEFDADELNEWESELPWAGGMIDLDITFEGAVMGQHTLDRLARYVTDLAVFDQQARTAMRAEVDGDEDSAVRGYVEHHLDEPDLIRPALGLDVNSEVSIDVFLTALRLVRVGLYASADVSSHEAIFDYTIDPDNTQYFLVVRFDDDGQVHEISMES